MNVNQANATHALGPSGGLGEELTVGGTVVSPAALSAPARYALVSVKANSIKVTFDGTDPATAGAGAIYAAGLYWWSAAMVKVAKCIEAGSSAAAVVRVEPFV
jgi:hypothetical protein